MAPSYIQERFLTVHDFYSPQKFFRQRVFHTPPLLRRRSDVEDFDPVSTHARRQQAFFAPKTFFINSRKTVLGEQGFETLFKIFSKLISELPHLSQKRSFYE